MNKILKINENCMGTLSLDAKFNGMRKSQDFIVYPMQKNDDTARIKIQSDTRIGYIDLTSGDVLMSAPRQGGSYFVHLIFAKKIDQLTNDDLVGLKFRLVQTVGEKVGNNGMHIFCDNSNADKVSVF